MGQPLDAEYHRHAEGRVCPVCGGPVSRTRRHLMDRITSLFAPNHRYRCRGFNCGWDGTLRIEPRTKPSAEQTRPG